MPTTPVWVLYDVALFIAGYLFLERALTRRLKVVDALLFVKRTTLAVVLYSQSMHP